MPNFYTKLIIDSQEIDLYDVENLPLNITKRVNSLDGEIQGDFSRASITVPATKTNKSILGNTRAFKPFRIEVDGQPSFNGIARVRRGKNYYQSYADIKETYEINLISNNSSWFALLGNSFMSEFTDLVVNYDESEILLGFASAPLVIDYGFAPIKLKEWANSTGSGATLRYYPSLYEMQPLLFIKPLLVAAFNSIGYTIQSDFFNTDYGQKLTMSTILPEKMPQGYNEKYLNTVVSMAAPVIYSDPTAAVVLFDTIDVAAPSNPTAYNPLTGYYTCPSDGYYEITIEYTFPLVPVPTGSVLADGFGSGAIQNGALISLLYDQISFDVPGYPAGQRRAITYYTQAVAGDTLATFLVWVDLGINPLSPITIDSAKMTINGEATPVQGMPIDFKYLLETFKFKDWLKGLVYIHNLTFETNEETRIVTIEPKDPYTNQTRTPTTSERKEGFYTNTQKDYSQIIDKSKKGSYKYPNLAGDFIYKYETDSDETITWLEGENEIGIYEARFKMDNGADTTRVKTKTVPFFAKTIHLLDYLTRFPDTTIPPQYPLIYPQNEVLDPTATERRSGIQSRIFYFAGQRDVSFGDGQLEFFEFPGIAFNTPACFMVNYNDTTGLDPNMGFNNQVINGVESIGLLQKYYLNELARNNKGEIKGNYIKFNSIDFLNFTFRTKAFIDGTRYIVQDLKGYNPLIDAPTSFAFFEDVYPTEEDVNNIENSKVTGVVTTFKT